MSTEQCYESRLKIPVVGQTLNLYTKTGLKIGRFYRCIVIGGRGPYIEFVPAGIVRKNMQMLEKDEWRKDSTNAYYLEYRTIDSSSVMIYYQKKEVDYADYKIGCYYISPFDLYLEDGTAVIEPIRKSKPKVETKLKPLW